MVNFSEKIVRQVSLVVFIVLLLLGMKHHWIWVLEIIPIMIFFSTKGVQMFEDKLWWGVRLFWAILFSCGIFLFIYKQTPDFLNFDKQKILIRVFIALCMGSWLGDFFAKYIYIRLRFCINRLGARGRQGAYKILEKKDYSQKYMKSPLKKAKISFYYVTLEVDSKPITFLTSYEIFEQIRNQNVMELTIKKGCLGYYYGVGY